MPEKKGESLETFREEIRKKLEENRALLEKLFKGLPSYDKTRRFYNRKEDLEMAIQIVYESMSKDLNYVPKIEDISKLFLDIQILISEIQTYLQSENEHTKTSDPTKSNIPTYLN